MRKAENKTSKLAHIFSASANDNGHEASYLANLSLLWLVKIVIRLVTNVSIQF